jgi:beta-fructofuranosidase
MTDDKCISHGHHSEGAGFKALKREWNDIPRGWLRRPSRFQTAGLLLTLLLVAVLHHGSSRAWPSWDPTLTKNQSQPTALHFWTQTGSHSGPTGLFVDDHKVWHIYFQSRSACSIRQQILGVAVGYLLPGRARTRTSWGHATSSDLYTWSTQPIALHSEIYDILDGCAVIDRNNTSGLFPHQTSGVVVVYARYHQATSTTELAVAHSIDGGYTFSRDADNRVLRFAEETQPLRHPKVIWHQPTQRWIMTVAQPMSASIGIFTSPNLLDWTAASNFTHQRLAEVGHGFEFPSLVPIPRLNSTGAREPNWPIDPGGTVKDYGDYILVTSFSNGSPLNGGSITRYFPGQFNGTFFHPMNHRIDRFIDIGPDNYGNQFFSGLPDGDSIVSLGLASNLGDLRSLTPACRSDRWSILTGPRECYLIHGPGEGDLAYYSRPVGLSALLGETIATLSAEEISGHSVHYNRSEAVLIEARVEMQPPDDEDVEVNLDFIFESSKSLGKVACTAIFRTWAADFGCARRHALTHRSTDSLLLDQMSARQIRPLLPFHNPAVRRWQVQAVVDRSILEVYFNEGVVAGTLTVSAEESPDTIRFRSGQIPEWATVSVAVQRLRLSSGA